ncbi:hypothetical protein A7A08_01719 [Methyloligella halotolerans]|uniref:Uncharacterized protein n=1 Tax=Methyloligella halotolerans TaxID=1177755 RepID=A0A1E2RZN8_9HYPH|nr:hypothetical protein [Methyloligella halotolerans]ODA67684.1 hypothetical protein A7A08_01719 [Methyloligella halotolerans]
MTLGATGVSRRVARVDGAAAIAITATGIAGKVVGGSGFSSGFDPLAFK